MGRLASAITVFCLHGTTALRRSTKEDKSNFTEPDPTLSPEQLEDKHWQDVWGHNKPRIFDGGEERVENMVGDCTIANGALCQAPFSCDQDYKNIPASSRPSLSWPDYHLWCGYPAYAYAGLMCQQKRYHEYGNSIMKAQMTRGWGTMSVEAQYCFGYGHCDDHNVTYSTTVEQAIEICNEKFDQQWWPKEHEKPGFAIYNRETTDTIDHDDQGETTTARGIGKDWYSSTTIIYRPYYKMWRFKERAKASCKMGNYHCDVIYCQEHYCSEPHYRNKFNGDRPEYFRNLYGWNYPPLVSQNSIGQPKGKGPYGGYSR